MTVPKSKKKSAQKHIILQYLPLILYILALMAFSHPTKLSGLPILALSGGEIFTLSQSQGCVKLNEMVQYYCTKYIDNYSNTASGIPECLGLFVSCLSDRLVDIVSDLPLLSLGIFIANPSLFRDLVIPSVPFSGLLINLQSLFLCSVNKHLY